MLWGVVRSYGGMESVKSYAQTERSSLKSRSAFLACSRCPTMHCNGKVREGGEKFIRPKLVHCFPKVFGHFLKLVGYLQI